MKSNKKMVLALGAAIVSMLVLAGSTLALFSDFVEGDATAKAGTVDIGMSDVVLENDGNINPGDHDPDNPGDPTDPTDPDNPKNSTPHSLTFDVTNSGNKSVYNRNVIVLSAKNAAGEILDARVFRIYENEDEELTHPALNSKLGEVVVKWYITEDGEKLASDYAETDGKVLAVKYVIDQDKNGKDQVLNGTGDAAEIESGYTSNSASYHYLFSMDRTADNSYQGCDINIDVICQAMQYRNTTMDDWDTFSTKSITTSVNKNVKVIPSQNQDADGNPIV